MKKHLITKKMFLDSMVVLIIAELTGAFTALIDGIITARVLDETCMAAYGIACTYFTIISIIAGVLMIGCQTLTIIAISKGNKDEANQIISICAFIGIVLTLIIIVIIQLFPGFVSIIFGAVKDTSSNSTIYLECNKYLKGVSIGASFWLLSTMLTPIIQLDGNGKIVKIAALCSAITDIGLDLLFAKVLNLGIFGMGLATSVSHIVLCIIIVGSFISKKSSFKISFKNLKFKYLGPVIKLGMPRAATMISRTIGPIIINIIVLNILTSNTGMTAISVQRAISYFCMAFGWGIAGSLLMLTSLYYNEKNFDELLSLIKFAIKYIIIIVGSFTIVMAIFTKPITSVYVDPSNVELFEYTYNAILWFVLSLPVLALNMSFANYLQGTGKILIANIINVSIESVNLIIAALPLALVSNMQNNIEKFWLYSLLGQAILVLECIIYYIVYQIKHRKSQYSKYLLPDNFESNDSVVIDKMIKSEDEALKLSAEVSKLCIDQGKSKKDAYYLSLCVEEMICNIFEHGFKDHKNHLIEARIVLSKDSTILTIRDDCRKFDATQKIKNWNIDYEHPESNIGIRMIMKLAKNVTYNNTMNINTLQITL